LPKSVQQFFADSLWLLAILRLVVGAVMLGMLGNLSGDSKATQILLIMFGAITVLTIPAIYPLINRKKLGWLLFFLTMPVQAIGVAASMAAASNMILTGAVIGAIVAGYVLLDIRSYFK
jgi:hypothetical protein